MCEAGYDAAMRYVGVDGCRDGWLAVVIDGDNVSWMLCPTFAGLVDRVADHCCLFVDIPIGLPATGTREADRQARNSLPGHLKGSIFNTPVRKAVYATDKSEAKHINQKLSGKSLSEQSLGIARKILEVDTVLQERSALRGRLFEAHPEVCFSRLAGHSLQYVKKDLLGGLERLRILEKWIDEPQRLLVEVRNEVARSRVGGDDVLDACVLAVAARKSGGSPACFPLEKNSPPLDETGLPMAIWFPE